MDALTRQLESRDPADRIRAVHSIGEEQIDNLIPALVNRLDDADAAVRLYTIVALEKLTGTRLGYEYAANRVRRQEAVANWRRYIEQRAHGLNATDEDDLGDPMTSQTETEEAG